MGTFQVVKLLDRLNPTIIAGGFVPRGTYDNATDYAVGDSVDYNGTSYVMFNDGPAGTLPTDDTYWQVVAGGIASGGTTGQVLRKQSAAAYDTAWETIDPDDLDDTSTTHKFTSAADISKLAGIEAGAEVNTVDSVNTQTGAVVLDADDIDDTSTTNKFTTAGDISKLAGIESGADVTDATNVAAAGAFMKATDDLDDITEGTTNKHFTATEKTKLSGIETAADVTDADNVGSSIHGSSGKTTPVDGDTVPLIDSEASNVLQKVTWANVKATVKSYFDTIYAAIVHTHTASAITDFDTEVSNNSDVTANTAARHVAVTLGTNTASALSLSGQELSIGDVFVQNAGDTMTGNLTFSGSQKIIGGTGTTSDLTLQTTSGVGTTGADMHFLVGNNGATEAMTILNGGNVGIGTTSPNYKLTVKSPGVSTFPFGIYASDGSNLFNIYEDASGYGRLDVRNNGGGVAIQLNTNGDSYLNSGNVGIGTTNPTNRLHVNSGTSNVPLKLEVSDTGKSLVNFTNTALTWATGINATSDYTISEDSSGNNPIVTLENGNTSEVLRIDGTGHVGIGTTAPGSKLHVVAGSSGATANASYDDFVLENSVTGGMSVLVPDNKVAGIALGTATDNVGGLINWDYSNLLMRVGANRASADLALEAGSALEVMRLTSGGNVGIGTTSPTAKLNISSGDDKDTGPIIRLNGNAANQVESGRVRFTEDSSANGYRGGYIHYDGVANILNLGVHTTEDSLTTNDINAISILRTNGNVGIGTTSPGCVLDINGAANQLNVQASGTNRFRWNVGASVVDLSSLPDATASSKIRFFRLTNTSSTDVGMAILKPNGLGTTTEAYISAQAQNSWLNASGGNVGIGTTSPTSTLALGGNSARVFQLERHTTANSAGNTLTITAGGATSGATDKNGGNLYLQGGLATGTGESGVVLFGCVAGATGTTDRTQTAMVRVLGNKIGFFTSTPVIKATALTAVDSNALNTGDATSDAVIANMRTRINELESRLQSYGLLS